MDVKQVGRELGVRYVLEGSVRKAGNRVRITGQLIDPRTGAHLWADRFDGGLERHLRAAGRGHRERRRRDRADRVEAEIERTRRAPAVGPFDYIVRGLASLLTWSREANGEALQLFRQAQQLDPNLGMAYAAASQCYTWSKSYGWLTDPASETAEGARLARRALELGKRAGHSVNSRIGIAYLEGDLDFGGAAMDRALELNPNTAETLGIGGWISVFRGEPDLAIERVHAPCN